MKAALRRRLGRAARVLEASGWDESQHPREPGGSSIGGRFANKGGPGLRMAAPAGQGGAPSVAVRRLSHEDMKATSDDAASSYIMDSAALVYGPDEHDDDKRAGALKDSVARRLSEAADIPYETANAIVATWATSANDRNLDSLELQEAISQEFGVPLSAWQQKRLDGLRALEGLDGGVLRADVLSGIRNLAAAASASDADGMAAALTEVFAVTERAGRPLFGDGSSEWSIGAEVCRRVFYDLPDNDLNRLVGILLFAGDATASANPRAYLPEAVNVEDGRFLQLVTEKMGNSSAGGAGENTRPATLRKAVRAMYEMTQADLADQGIRGDLLLFRGTTLERDARAPRSGQTVRTPTNAASSWTSERDVAQNFGGQVMARRVPVARILSSPVTGLGCLREFEFVVLGDPSGFEDQTAHFILGERVGEAFAVPLPRVKRRRLLEAARILEHGASGWNEAQHPREPAGTATGGQFTAKAADGSALQPGHLVPWSREPAAAPSTYSGPVPEGGVNGTQAEQKLAADMAGAALENLDRRRYVTQQQAKAAALQAAVAIHRRLGGAAPLPTVVAAIEQWTHSANDHSLRAMSLQEAAAEEFGAPLSQWQRDNLKSLEYLRRKAEVLRQANGGRLPPGMKHMEPVADRATERRILRAMYEETQERLRAVAAARGLPPYVYVYRGANMMHPASRPRRLPRGTVVRTPTNALGSYAPNKQKAEWFAEDDIGLVTAVRVPFERILSTPLTGFGDPAEGEFVVLGEPSGYRFEVVESAP